MFGINKKVWILQQKTDGRYNKGVVVGIEKIYEGFGYLTEKQYFSDFVPYRYKVAYVDVFTKKACCEWVHHSDVTDKNPQVKGEN